MTGREAVAYGARAVGTCSAPLEGPPRKYVLRNGGRLACRRPSHYSHCRLSCLLSRSYLRYFAAASLLSLLTLFFFFVLAAVSTRRSPELC